jgi:flagellar hook assembly protein FlgD
VNAVVEQGQDANASAPAEFVLMQNYPNPFNPTTTFRFSLPARAQVRLEVFDILGQKVRDWPWEFREAGYHQERWDGLNWAGMPVASGEYFLRMSAETQAGGKVMRKIKMKLIQ